ncbi:MAG TPA: FtsX-like permease family protein [Thermoanaerobaculia bacterium]|nr:FtsX-like permease family protein [Thermoanaerobaculia bacterium]
MSLAQALAYFFREAAGGLRRGWKVSLLAVFTIAVSLFVGGVFLLASGNLARALERWRAETRVVVYLRPGTPPPAVERLRAEAARGPAWVRGVEAVSPQAARARFAASFPALSDLLRGWGEEPLPATLEIELARDRPLPASELEPWLAAWRARPEVEMVDEDREWLGQLEAIIAVLRGIGLALGGVLLAAAIFTIGSVIRLIAYLHHEEIAILRLVGATELFVRGPFYAEGLLQGLLGGGLALAALFAGWQVAQAEAQESLLATLLAARFLTPGQSAALLLLGGAAGLIGAVASLRRETLRSEA